MPRQYVGRPTAFAVRDIDDGYGGSGETGAVLNEGNLRTLFAQFDSASTTWTLAGDAAISSTNANTDIGATNALQLDGTGDSASLATSISFGRASAVPMSAEIWARTTVALTTTNTGIFEYVDSSSGSFGIFHYGTTQTVQVERNGGSTFGTGTLTQNTWVHVAFAMDASNNAAIFVDGTRVGTSSGTGFGGTANGTFKVGSANTAFSGNAFTGQLSGLRIVLGREVYDPTESSIAVPTTMLKVL